MALNLKITQWIGQECGEFEDEGVKHFLAELDRESDRSAVLVTAALIEEMLDSKCRDLLRHGSQSAIDALLRGTGGIATLSAKIDLLYCAGVIQVDLRNSLHALRRLRNDCAHSWTQFELGDAFAKEVLPCLGSERLEEIIETAVSADHGFKPALTSRMRFELAAALLMLRCRALCGGS